MAVLPIGRNRRGQRNAVDETMDCEAEEYACPSEAVVVRTGRMRISLSMSVMRMGMLVGVAWMV